MVVLVVVVVVVEMVSTLVAAATRATVAISVGNGNTSGSTRGTKSVQILTAGGPWLSIGEVTWPQLELISLRFAHRRTDHYDQHDKHG
uniref:Secreted protein n=1 Tax=Anopheles funestus TaxID=62324 RepID=A0A182RPM0_ANOFN